MSNKLHPLVIIFLIIAILAISLSSLTNKSANTQSTTKTTTVAPTESVSLPVPEKIYKNEQYRFSMAIPEDWTVNKDYTTGTITFGVMENTDPNGARVNPFMSTRLWVEVARKPEAVQTLKQAQNLVISCDYDKNNADLVVTSQKIGDKDALIIKNSACGLITMDALLWMDETSIYTLKTYQEIDQFLPTFKFIEHNTTK